jgi:hypothetical protein
VTFTAREPKDDGRCIDAQCSCGCALKLSTKDHADAARCIAQAGPGPYAGIKLEPTEHKVKAEKPEPTKRVFCPECDEPYEMAEYLVDALKSRGSEASKCGACRGESKQREIEPHWADGEGT